MRTTGKATDLITFSRSSGGTALRKIAYGPELVTNGTFDTDTTGWGGYAGATLSYDSARQALSVSSDGSSYVYTEALGLTAGKVYLVSFDLLDQAVVTNFGFGDATIHYSVSEAVAGVGNRAVGTYSAVVVAVQDDRFKITHGGGGAQTFSIDNISVKEVLFDQGDLTLFNHPADIPRIEYDANGNVLGLLVEESRTNRFLYSASFSDWVLVRASLSDNTDGIIAPDGSVAKILISDTTPSNSHLTQKNSVTAAANSIACGSVFLKKQPSGIVTHAQIKLTDDAAGASNQYAVMIDLSTGAITDTGTSGTVTSPFNSVQSVGDGWYRVSLGFTKNNTATRTDLQIILSASATMAGTTPIVFSGDGTSGAYIWGTQLEEGAFPTSYIPTSGSTATRSADVASIATSEFGYRDDEGTVVVDGSYFNTYTGSPYPRFLAFRRTFGLRESIEVLGFNDNISAAIYDENVLSSGSATSGKEHKVAVALKEDDFAISFSGGAAVADTSGGMPQDISIVEIGNYSGSAYINGHIKSIKYMPRRLTNDQLVEITS